MLVTRDRSIAQNAAVWPQRPKSDLNIQRHARTHMVSLPCFLTSRTSTHTHAQQAHHSGRRRRRERRGLQSRRVCVVESARVCEQVSPMGCPNVLWAYHLHAISARCGHTPQASSVGAANTQLQSGSLVDCGSPITHTPIPQDTAPVAWRARNAAALGVRRRGRSRRGVSSRPPCCCGGGAATVVVVLTRRRQWRGAAAGGGGGGAAGDRGDDVVRLCLSVVCVFGVCVNRMYRCSLIGSGRRRHDYVYVCTNTYI